MIPSSNTENDTLSLINEIFASACKEKSSMTLEDLFNKLSKYECETLVDKQIINHLTDDICKFENENEQLQNKIKELSYENIRLNKEINELEIIKKLYEQKSSQNMLEENYIKILSQSLDVAKINWAKLFAKYHLKGNKKYIWHLVTNNNVSKSSTQIEKYSEIPYIYTDDIIGIIIFQESAEKQINLLQSFLIEIDKISTISGNYTTIYFEYESKSMTYLFHIEIDSTKRYNLCNKKIILYIDNSKYKDINMMKRNIKSVISNYFIEYDKEIKEVLEKSRNKLLFKIK